MKNTESAPMSGAKEGEARDDPRDKLEGSDIEKFKKFQEILEETTPDFERISLALRKDIKSRYYDTILADDVSGRLVGCFLHRLMHRDGEEDGYAPRLFFYAGGQDGGAKRRTDSDIANIDSMLGQHVLIVTELINAGGSIRLAREALEARNHDVGIASLAVLGREGVDNARGGELKNPRFYQGESKGAVLHGIAGTGMRKNYKQDGKVVRNEDESAVFVAATRLEIRELADTIYNKIFAVEASKKRKG